MATRNLRRPSILLVGKSIDDSQVYASALRAWGYRVVNAETTILGYHIATTTPTDIVVTDGYCAGSMSGLELTRRLRIHSGTATLPIIVITSETRRQDGDLSIKAGGVMEYRDKWPVLSAVAPDSREPRERLRYVSGWFCSDHECGYQELARRTG